MGKVSIFTAVAIATWIGVVAPSSAAEETPITLGDNACIPADKCCKVCDAGMACGNTCISRAKQCHKGRGCACNATEVCGN